MEKKIEKLMEDKAFVAELAAMETVDDMAEALNARGVEITADELVQAQDVFLAKQNGELNEEDLDQVAGGAGPLVVVIVWGVVIWTVVSVIKGAYDGMNSCYNKKGRR